jgi:thiol-disulfide isomerase/thioredoxin
MIRLLTAAILATLISSTAFAMDENEQDLTTTTVQTTNTAHNENALIAKFAENNVLYFFYDTNCPYCQKFAPILKDFAVQYNFKVIGITDDGDSFAEFPNTKRDTGESVSFGTSGEPMLYAMNTRAQKRYLIADGLVSARQLKANILRAAKRQ